MSPVYTRQLDFTFEVNFSGFFEVGEGKYSIGAAYFARNGNQLGAIAWQQVHLIVAAVAIEVKVCGFAFFATVFQEFDNGEILEYRTARMVAISLSFRDDCVSEIFFLHEN